MKTLAKSNAQFLHCIALVMATVDILLADLHDGYTTKILIYMDTGLRPACNACRETNLYLQKDKIEAIAMA